MISWLFIFVPILAAIILLIFFRSKVAWWELALLIVPSALIIMLMNTIMVSYRTGDTEYFGNYTTKVIYYEPVQNLMNVEMERHQEHVQDNTSVVMNIYMM